MKHKAFVSMGSNMGNAKKNLENARIALAEHADLRISAVSSIYLTEPQGFKEQSWFMNQVILIECSVNISPDNVLNILMQTESKLGRIRDGHNRFGPRCIDLDLLLYDNVICNTSSLILPHPRMTERAFVLIPLLEIQSDIRMPDGRKAEDILSELNYRLDNGKIFQ